MVAQDALFPSFDVRSRLLGGTGLAAAGLDAVWTNPAGLAETEDELSAAAYAEQRFGLSELSNANMGVAYGAGAGGFGLQLASLGYAGYRENRVGLAYGRQLTEALSVGVDFVGFGTATEGYASTFDVTFGLGLRLRVRPNLFVGTRIFSPVRTERLPDEYLPQLLAVGFSYRPSDRITLNAEVHQDADHPARFRAGVAYQPAEEVTVRLGVATEASELSFGLGYRVLDTVELTAGAVWHESLGVWPGVGVRWR